MPEASPDRPAVVRFGPFELDLRAGGLSSGGVRTRTVRRPAVNAAPMLLSECLRSDPRVLALIRRLEAATPR